MDLNHHFKHYFIVDIETSGRCPIKNGIISFSLGVTDLNLNLIDVFQRRVRPPFLSFNTWSKEAEGVHGISFDKVLNFTPNDQFCYELLCFLSKYKHPDNFPQPFVCHASPNGKPRFGKNGKPDGGYEIHPWFDYYFLEWAMRKARFENGQEMVWSFYKIFNGKIRYSTVEMGRKAGYTSNKLNTWAERLNFDLKHHDDLSDMLCALEIFKLLHNKNNEQIYT